MSKLPISVCIIAKNEEKFIEECLKRIKSYGFEIIVTDTGSTDRTREIAMEYADKVCDFPWIDDFSAARNYCASQATNPWILALDCDEYVEKLDVQVTRILMQKMPKGVGNIRMKILVYDQNKQIQYTTEEVMRFYNRNYYQFEGAIHEQVTPFDWDEITDGEKVLKAFLLPIDLVHQGYVLSKEEMHNKQIRNLEIIEQELSETPDDPYLLFQCAQSNYICGNVEKAVSYYEKALSYQEPASLVYVQACIMGLAKAYVQLDRPVDALVLLKQYEEDCKSAKFVFMQACIYQDTRQWMKSLLYYVKATTMEDKDTLGANLINCYRNIIDLATQFGNDGIASLYQKKYQDSLEEKERILSTMEQEPVKEAI